MQNDDLKGVSMADDVNDVILEKLEEIEAGIEVLRENDEEILEKLANLGLPGVDYSIRDVDGNL